MSESSSFVKADELKKQASNENVTNVLDEGDEQLFDKYGFVLDGQKHTPSAKERKKIAKSTNKRLKKWLAMLEEWEKLKYSNFELIKKRCRKGIPDAVRGRAWQFLCDANKLHQSFPDVYSEYYVKERTECEGDISRDINRTFPTHELFKRSELGADALTHLLRAYSAYDKLVGYCQGMAFIASVLLIHMPEQEAFYVMVQLFTHYQMRDLFVSGMRGLSKMFFVFEELQRHHTPRLYEHFTAEGMHPSMFASQWFITLYSYNFDFDVVLRVWDVFMAEGNWKIIYRIAIAILQRFEAALLCMKFEDIILFFKETHAKLRDGDELMGAALSIKISRLDIERLEKKYEVSQRANP